MPQLQHQHHLHHHHHHHHNHSSPWKLEGAAPAAVLDLDTAVKDGILGGGGGGGGGGTAAEKKAAEAEKVVVVDLRKMMEELEAAAAAAEEEGEGDGDGSEDGSSSSSSVPAVFICPISLEPMVDPVTLCTGQTYERAHIARWLGMGHLTCPTTMQDLWDGGSLTPNRTLHHLIVSWFSARHLRLKRRSADVLGRAAALLASLRGKLKSPARAHALALLRRLALAHPSVRALPDLPPTVAALLGPLTPHAVGAEAALLLSLLLSPSTTTSSSSSSSSSSSTSSSTAAAAAATAAATATATTTTASSAAQAVQLLLQPQRFALLVDLLGDGAPDTKLACARLLLALAQDPAFRPESAASLRLFAALLRLVRDRRRHPPAALAALALIQSLSDPHDNSGNNNNNNGRVLSMLVTVGAVPTLIDVADSAAANVAGSPGRVGELLEPALGILDRIGSAPEGRGALKECPRTIPSAVRALMRVSEPCTRAALNVLWAVCKLAPEECAPAAVEAGLAAKLLLVIQSGCAQELKQRAAELLKLCSLNYNATHFISKCKLTRTIQ